MKDILARCRITGKEFMITEDDQKFYEKMGVPLPTLCPEERERRRMMWSNQITLFNNTCSATGKPVISNYSPDSGIPIMDAEYWRSDKWDQYATGRDFDFNRPFFDQWIELFRVAPRPNLHRGHEFDENADYTNYAGKNKNCYLIFDSDKNRDCYYSYSINSCESVMDCFRTRSSELCYECIDCEKCYNSQYLQNCKNCIDSHFLKNSIGCKNCFGCVNLRNKQYYFMNEKCTKEEYEKKLQAIDITTYENIKETKKRFLTFSRQFPNKYMEGVQNENVIGNYVNNSKNAYYCFDSQNLWDCRYLSQAFDDAKDCMDCTEVGDGAELLYEVSTTGYNVRNLRFCSHSLGEVYDMDYSFYCPNSSHCFGCVALHNAKYCILNKQYTKEQYEALVPKIIEHMKKTGEWGEFFPGELSPFPYNETHAFDYYPLTKEEALSRGYTWRDDDIQSQYQGVQYEVPEHIKDVQDDITKAILRCEVSGKNFKIIPQEFTLYRRMDIPIPKKCFNERHKERLSLRTPRKLWDRNCMKCHKEVKSSYSPDREEIIYCDECYLNSIN